VPRDVTLVPPDEAAFAPGPPGRCRYRDLVYQYPARRPLRGVPHVERSRACIDPLRTSPRSWRPTSRPCAPPRRARYARRSPAADGGLRGTRAPGKAREGTHLSRLHLSRLRRGTDLPRLDLPRLLPRLDLPRLAGAVAARGGLWRTWRAAGPGRRPVSLALEAERPPRPQSGVYAGNGRRRLDWGVSFLDCASPLALWNGTRAGQSGRGLPHSKALRAVSAWKKS